jgi:hypothetical protein
VSSHPSQSEVGDAGAVFSFAAAGSSPAVAGRASAARRMRASVVGFMFTAP